MLTAYKVKLVRDLRELNGVVKSELAGNLSLSENFQTKLGRLIDKCLATENDDFEKLKVIDKIKTSLNYNYRVRLDIYLNKLYRQSEELRKPKLVAERPKAKFVTVSEEVLKEVKSRTVNTDEKDLDPFIRGAVKVLNSVPWLATVWSCQGHVKLDSYETAYIQVVVLEGNLDKLMTLWGGLLSRITMSHYAKLVQWVSRISFYDLSSSPLWIMDFGYRLDSFEDGEHLSNVLKAILKET